jgi:hypothetical protein
LKKIFNYFLRGWEVFTSQLNNYIIY